jgi:hypothetical protein
MKLFPIASYRLWLLGIVTLTAGTWFFINWLVQPGYSARFCGTDPDIVCILYWNGVFGDLYHSFFLKSIIITTIILMFLPERAFKWWRWFAVVAIPFLMWSFTKQPPAYSDAIKINFEGEAFLSLSTALITFSLLFSKIKDHHFIKPLHRYGAYLGALAFSLLIGFLLIWGILWALN